MLWCHIAQLGWQRGPIIKSPKWQGTRLYSIFGNKGPKLEIPYVRCGNTYQANGVLTLADGKSSYPKNGSRKGSLKSSLFKFLLITEPATTEM